MQSGKQKGKGSLKKLAESMYTQCEPCENET